MKNLSPKKLLGITLPTSSREISRENILKYASENKQWGLVMSLNPEIFTLMQNNPEFKRIVQSAQFKIVDGVGVVIAARMLGIPVGERYTGVDMMDDLVNGAAKRRLRLVLIGGKGNVAEYLADCYSAKYPNLNVVGLSGFEDISHPTHAEEEKVFSIVADLKPHIILTAFGSPAQELWMYRNRAQLGNALCAGVGGAFDFHAGRVARAPRIVQSVGLEWLFRLLNEPWRWRRQLRIVRFLYDAVKERI